MNQYDPKSRFISNAVLAGQHRQRCQDSSFISAIDAAFLRYHEQLTLNYGTEPNAAASNHHKLVGAREFVMVLLNLAETVDLPARAKTPSLNYKT